MHATHTVHAVPDLRIAGGRFGDDFLFISWIKWGSAAPKVLAGFDRREVVTIPALPESRRLRIL